MNSLLGDWIRLQMFVVTYIVVVLGSFDVVGVAVEPPSSNTLVGVTSWAPFH